MVKGGSKISRASEISLRLGTVCDQGKELKFRSSDQGREMKFRFVDQGKEREGGKFKNDFKEELSW